jgi:hypothetical protein
LGGASEHETLLVISVLALLTFAGAVFADRSLTSGQGFEQVAS